MSMGAAKKGAEVNAAYTPEYLARRRAWAGLFARDNFQEEEMVPLSGGYRLVTRSYAGVINGCRLTGSRNILWDRSGKRLGFFETHDDEGEFAEIISHRNGREYLIFRRELYGYSVLDLHSGEEFHFVPRAMLEGRETFIWTGVCYNPENNILAVSGCFWACPWGTLLLDFSNPMTETGWADIHAALDAGYERYDDMEFRMWRGTDLILDCRNQRDGQVEEVVLERTAYEAWLRAIKE